MRGTNTTNRSLKNVGKDLNYTSPELIELRLKALCTDSNELDYVMIHKYRLAYILKTLLPKISPGIKIASVGVSIIDPLINEVVSLHSAYYECLVPNVQFLEFYASNPAYKSVAVKIYDITKDNKQASDIIERYDVVLFYETLEHLMAPDELIIGNITKILKKKGFLIGSVPNAACLYNRLRLLIGKNVHWSKSEIINGVFNGFGHIREYTFSEVYALLFNDFKIKNIIGYSPYGRNWARVILNLLPSKFRDVIFFEANKK